MKASKAARKPTRIRSATAGISLVLVLLPAACGDGGTASGTGGGSTSGGGAGGAGGIGGSTVSVSSGGETTSSGSGTTSSGSGTTSSGSGVTSSGSGATSSGSGTTSSSSGTTGSGGSGGQGGSGGSGVCSPGDGQPCYEGPSGTLGIGVCKGGIKTCDAQGTGFGACAGQVLPSAETCATPGDDDCDGQVNEGGVGCVCAPNAAVICYAGPTGTAGVGTCKAGSQLCDDQGTALGACAGAVLPQAEICGDALDNDCDGQVDEGCVCAAGSTAPCYGGPAGTMGVGVCHAGTHTCSPTGDGYGPCVGEVLPQVDSCSTPADEDCDGVVAGVCSGAHLWSKAWGGVPDDEGNSLAIDASDNILYAGYTTGPVDYGCGALPVAAGVDSAVLMKLAPGGSCTWSKAFGNNAQMLDVAVDPSGNVLTTGMFGVSVDLGNGLVTSAGGNDGFVAKFDSLGNHLWSKTFGDAAAQSPDAVASDAAGNLITCGYFNGTIDLGGGPLTSAGGVDIYVAKFSPTGALLWSKRFGDGANQGTRGLAVDASGNVVITGSFVSTVNFGGVTLTSAGGADVYVAKLDPNGNYLWSKRFGDTLNQVGAGVATDAAGDVYFTGYLFGAMDFGGGTLTSVSGVDTYLVKLDPAGNHLWSKRGGGTGDQAAVRVAVDPVGNVSFVGIAAGSGSFGGGVLTSAGATDILVAKYDSSGNHLWSKLFGNPATQGVKGLAVDSQGNLVLTGLLFGPTDFGGGPIIAGGGEDTFIAKLSP